MPLRVGLTYTQMKLGWADKRLNELRAAVLDFRRDKNAYLVRGEDDVHDSLHRIYIEQKITPDPIPLLLGEFAYALRSGLDQLAWQLALLTTDTPNVTTCFPVYKTAPKPKSRYWESVSDIPPKASAIIDALQPYHRGEGFKTDPLWQLNRLCIVDKHEVMAVNAIEFQIGIFNVSAYWNRADEHGMEVSVPLAEKQNLVFYVNVPDVVFGEPIESTDARSDFEITLDGLTTIYNFVRYDVVPRFEIFFPQ